MTDKKLTLTKDVTVTVLLLFCLLMTALPASAQENTATSLDISILKYEPFPAEIGQYVDVWVKVENFRSGQSDDVSIKLEPEYPLSLDSPNNALKDIGILSPDSASVQEYRLYVDENTKPGVASFDILYQGSENGPWLQDTFELKVGSTTFDSKGTLELTETNANPQVFSPGDTGTISFKLTNTAAETTINFDGQDYDTNARIQSAILKGSENIMITSGVQEAGIIGPGNSVTLTFNIEVPEDIQEGTYYLDLDVIGNSHSYNNVWRVPITIDSSSLKMVPSKALELTNGEGKLQFDVANLHPNTLSSVSIRPEAEGLTFSPTEYFVGSMKPDELFTIEFITVAEDDYVTAPITLEAEYKNGYNDHSVNTNVGEVGNTIEKSSSSGTIIVVVIGLVILAGSGFYIYRKRKQDQA